MDTLTTTKKELALDALLADDSTFYGDLFPHAVHWRGELYSRTYLHRALRAALQQRNVIHVRVLDLDALTLVQAPARPPRRSPPALPVPNPRRALTLDAGLRRCSQLPTRRAGPVRGRRLRARPRGRGRAWRSAAATAASTERRPPRRPGRGRLSSAVPPLAWRSGTMPQPRPRVTAET